MSENSLNGFEQKETIHTPEEILGYGIYRALDVAQHIESIKVMIAIAKERGIQINLEDNPTIKALDVFGEYEKQMIAIGGAMLSLRTTLLDQGVRITAEEMEAAEQNSDVPEISNLKKSKAQGF